MSRGSFLKLTGAGVAGVFALSIMGSGGVLAQTQLRGEFDAAAEKYSVPVELLLAMGYVNTRWEMPQPAASNFEEEELDGKGLFGIMALVRNPSADTLGEASALTGISEDKLKTDRQSNIMGGAALLAKSQGEKPFRLGEWLGAVNGDGGNGRAYDAIGGIGGGELYVDQVLDTLKGGAEAEISTGEKIVLAPQNPASRTAEKTGEVL
jgi:hypothetical protein